MLRGRIRKEVKNIVVLFNTCSFRKYNKLNLTYEKYYELAQGMKENGSFVTRRRSVLLGK
jgi:hypothetical protein